MQSINYYQILYLVFQCFTVAFIILLLFRLRTYFGLSLLFAALGVFQYMQVFLANTLYFEVYPNIFISSGSSIIFTGSIFAILLIYLKEDALQARKAIYGILTANILLILLQFSISIGITDDKVLNVYNLPIELFNQNSKISIVGSMLIFLDSFLIIFIYEAVSKKIQSTFFRILYSTIFILSVDSVLFGLGAFNGSSQVKQIIISGLISKNLAAIIYSFIFTLYLKYIDKRTLKLDSKENVFKDVFHSLTFRQRFETLYKENETQMWLFEQTKLKYKYLINNTSEGFYRIESEKPIAINLPINKQIDLMYKHMYISECNDAFAKLYGFNTASEMIGYRFFDLHGSKIIQENIEALTNFIKNNYTITDEYTVEKNNKGNFCYFLNNADGIIENNALISFWGTQRDVTEKRKIEIALLEANTIINRSESVAFLWQNNENWTVEFVSENVFKLTGYTAQEFISQEISYANIILPEDKERVFNQIKIANNNSKITHFKHQPYRIITKNNQIKWIQDQSYLRRNKNNIITHCEGIISDITDKVNTNIQLINEKNKAQNYLNVAGVMLVSIDANGLVELINPKGCEILGYTKEEIIGKNWVENFIPKDQINTIKDVSKLVYEGKIEQVKKFENEIITKEGEKKLIAWTNVLILDNDGKIVSTLSSGEDITERKKTEHILKINEEKYRTLFEHAPEGILIANSESYYLDANTAICKMLGYTHHELVGLHAEDIVVPNEIENIQPALNTIISENYYEKEWLFKRKDGSTFTAEVTVTTLPDGNLLALVKDVTEQKLLKANLIQEKELLKVIINNIPVMLSLYDPNINMLFFNEEFETKLGVTTKDADEMDFMKLFYPDEQIRKQAADFMLNAPKEWREFPISTKNGTILNTEWTNIKLANGTQIGIGLDITERKLAHKKLQEQKDFLELLINHIPNQIFWKDNNLVYQGSNKVFSEIVGAKSPQDVIGKTDYDFDRDNSFAELYRRWDTRILESGKPELNIEEKYFNAQGKEGYLLTSKIPIKNSDDEILGVLGICIDVTESKLAQKTLIKFNERLKLLHKIDAATLSAKNIKHIAEDVLKKLKNIIPYQRATLLNYDNKNNTYAHICVNSNTDDPYILNAPISADELEFIDTKMLLKGEVLFFINLKKHKFTSTLFKKIIDTGLNSLIIIPLITENQLIGILTLLSDTSDIFTDENIQISKEIANQLAILLYQNKLKQEIIEYTENLEEKIKERTEQLEFSNRELRDFAQIVSHDLKAPLRAISQLSYWISKDYSDKIDAAGQEQLSMLIGRVKRLDNLIEGVLQYSRAGKAREKEIIIDLNTLVQDVIISLNPAENINIKVDTVLPKILGDPTRFSQVFQNLIENAIKFNDKPSVTINIGCINKIDIWEFYITDNGPGIEEKYFDRIFQIFQRLESRDNHEGTGVGLTLVKRIIQIYNGTIWITSEINKGTTFHFTLPIKI